MEAKTFNIGIVGRLSESVIIGYCSASKRVQTARAPGLDWRAMAPSASRARIGELLAMLAKSFELPNRTDLVLKTRSLALAIAGIDDRFSIGLVEQALGMLGFEHETVTMASVGMAAHVGAFLGQPGIVVNCGGGVSVYAKSIDGREMLFGGWGSVAGDRGSGPWIGRQATIAVTHVLEGGGENEQRIFVDRLTASVKLNTPLALIEEIERNRYWCGEFGVKQYLDLIGHLTIKLASDGDEYARNLIERSWDHLLSNLDLAVRFVGPEPLALCFRGAALEASSFYCQGLGSKISSRFPTLTIVPPGCIGMFAPIMGVGVIATRSNVDITFNVASQQLEAAMAQEKGIRDPRVECSLVSSISREVTEHDDPGL